MQGRMFGGNGHLNGDLKLNDIAYIGSHNCAIAKCYGWVYAQQNVSITEQFEKYGARHFKVPLHWFNSGKYPEIAVAHEGDGGNNCKLSIGQRALKDPELARVRVKEIVDLAFKYPNEIIILKLESKLLQNTKRNGTKLWDSQLVDIMLHTLLKEIRADQRAITWENDIIPTLGWCRDNSKNLLITIEPKEHLTETLSKYLHFAYKISAQVDWEIDPLKEVTSSQICRGITDKKEGTIISPFLEIHLNPEVSLKLDSTYRQKYNSYEHVKKRFLAFNEHCKKMPNFIVGDYIDQGQLQNIIEDINAIVNTHRVFLPELLAGK